MKLLLITPPLLQLNTPYPAMPILANVLRSRGYAVEQRDFSLETALRIFTPELVRRAQQAAQNKVGRTENLEFFLEQAEEYVSTVSDVVAFLQGRRPELAWIIACRNFLPEGPFFQTMDGGCSDDGGEEWLQDGFGSSGMADRAKYLASLYLDDLSVFLREALDEDFVLGRYAEKLCLFLPGMEPLLKRLAVSTFVDEIIDSLTDEALAASQPDFVGVSVPFPGTLYGAFRIAQRVRQQAPQVNMILGGGFVNSELRSVEDPRLFDFFDYVSLDDGCLKLEAILNGAVPRGMVRELPAEVSGGRLPPALLSPDYHGLDLDRYLSVMESPNRMISLWTDGVWLKMQLAQGCYWHKCAFCDVSLEYIKCYRPASPKEIVDAMEKLMADTGRRGFHFVDEALAPALVRGVCSELLSRGLHVVWWGNIRFDTGFDEDLTMLMAQAGCIAVTGGLECAHDRLLKLMNKGITVAGARNVLRHFKDVGIMVHAYLMYGFPTETAQEAQRALEFVRACFAEGLLTSAFWHRFALTAHSPVAREPAKYGIEILPSAIKGPRFCLNELPFREADAPDWERLGQGLSTAVYNYMLGRGLDLPVKRFLSNDLAVVAQDKDW